jgi:hypothetical protein
MWKKEIGKCYHLWINPHLIGKLTHRLSVASFRIMVDKQYLQDTNSSVGAHLLIDTFFIQSSTDTFFYRNMHQLLPHFVVSEDRRK